jgi:uncharacterized membrane protein YkvA (DUF1232 family)
MELTDFLPKVFVSHSWKDKITAQQLTDGLRDLNVATVWLDFENLKGGDVIDEVLEREIRQMDYLLLVWTQHSAHNQNVANELAWARRHGVKIIPCFFEFEPESGSIVPPPAAEVGALLGIEFRKMHVGLVALSQIFQKFTNERLPDAVRADSELENASLKAIGEFNSYLVNYRNVRNTTADRVFWVEKICDSLDVLRQSPQHAELVQQFLTYSTSLRDTDPAAFAVIERRFLQPAATAAPTASEVSLLTYNSAFLAAFDLPALDALRLRYLAMIHAENSSHQTVQALAEALPDHDAAQKQALVQQLVEVVGAAIAYLNYAYLRAVQAEKTEAFQPILDFSLEYYADENDLQPDHIGVLGWIDDTYLAFSSLLKINELYIQNHNMSLIDDDLQPYVDYCRSALSAEIAQQLDERRDAKFSSVDWNTLLLGLAGLALGGLLLNALFGGGGSSASQSSSSGGGHRYIEDSMAETMAHLKSRYG